MSPDHRNYDSLYWIGTYGCLVPNFVNKCVAEDGINIIYKNGFSTNILSNKKIDRKKWLTKYTFYKNETNQYYYKIWW